MMPRVLGYTGEEKKPFFLPDNKTSGGGRGEKNGELHGESLTLELCHFSFFQAKLSHLSSFPSPC